MPPAFTVALSAQAYPSGNDLRNGLKTGLTDAEMALQGRRLLSTAPKAAPFDTARGLTFVNSDLAFRGSLVYQGNFAGFSIWDVSNPSQPTMAICCSSRPMVRATGMTAAKAG